MPLKFRLRGLAETFVDHVQCPKCGHNGGANGDEGFETGHTKVTFDGIVVVVECKMCSYIFVPETQRLGVLNPRKLRQAVEKDSQNTGLPIVESISAVRLDVERINATRGNNIH